MAASEITLPDAWMQAYKLLYPATDFTQVHFYLGFPQPLGAGEQAVTIETWNGQNVYVGSLQESDYCDFQFTAFLLIAHELVHVLQIQKGPHLSWTTRYAMCVLTSGFSTGPPNCFEKEAYSYADGTNSSPGLLACQLLGLSPKPPCPCDANQLGPAPKPYPGDPNALGPMPAPYTCDPRQILMLPIFNPNFETYINNHPELTKSSTSCTVGDCLSEAVQKFNIGGLLLDAAAIILAPFIALATLGGVNVGMVVGSILGLIGGAILGDLVGAIVGALIGAMIAFLGAALGGLIGALLQDFFDFLFGGDSGGQLNLKSSSDDGLDFGSKHSFERSREQMALVLTGDTLYVGWTGNDAQVNVLAISQSLPNSHAAKTSFEQSNHCGPAIAWDDSTGNLFVAWVGTEGHLNIAQLISRFRRGAATLHSI